jgi:hypothetical protein
VDVPLPLLALARALSLPDFGPAVFAELVVTYADGQRRTLTGSVAAGPAPVAGPPVPVPPPAPARTHSPDFRLVTWDGQSYSLSKTQAAVVGLLWRARDAGQPGLSLADLKDATSATRLRDVFRLDDGRRAWGTLVLANGDGTYRLPD